MSTSECESVDLADYNRRFRSELFDLLTQHMDSYPDTNPYAALRATFAKHARRHKDDEGIVIVR